ncbi:MAG TPA: tetratricopeptide repeat protein, partial [Terriglobia bacterium]|nr:tetratricopeptide repeat protein [Terriglobia bacterium]
QYNRKLADLLAVQGEIASEISKKLRVRLSGDDRSGLTKHSTENPEAYRLYLKGRYFAAKATPEDLNKGIGYLNQAIALDPTYALAYEGISYYYTWADDLVLAPRDAMPKAKEAAQKALELDDGLPQAHTDMAMVLHIYDWNWAAAEQEYRRAIQLDPSYAAAHEGYGYLLVSQGRMEEGLRENQRAVELDPLSSESNWLLGWMLYLGRRYDPAGEQLRRTVDLDPNYFLAHVVLGACYAQKGQMSEAIPEFEKGVSLGECNQSLGELGRAYALAGKRQEAQKIADRLIAEWKRTHVGAFEIAIVQVGLGDKDQALAWLEKAYEDRSFFMVDFKDEPELDPLRSDPRFKDLLRRMNFPT